jgi:hypothetical protein
MNITVRKSVTLQFVLRASLLNGLNIRVFSDVYTKYSNEKNINDDYGDQLNAHVIYCMRPNTIYSPELLSFGTLSIVQYSKKLEGQ